MTRSLTWKLSLAFLLVTVTVALLVAVFIRVSNAGQLDRLIVEQQRSEFRELLIAYYQAGGSWDSVWEYALQTRVQARPLATPHPGFSPGYDGGGAFTGSRRERHELFGLADAQGLVVVPLLPDYPEGAQVSAEVLAEGESIEVDGEVVGTILTAARLPGLNPEEAAFLQRTTWAVSLAAAGAVVVALVAGLLLARTLTQPLRALTQAAHRMAGGALEQEVLVKSNDEIGELAAAFNRMSREVAQANTARRQMAADVAHDLRTPLTVIAGYIESLRDGVLAPTPERLSVIYAEIERLQNLVEDLRTLTQADAGELRLNKQSLSPRDLIEQALAAFEPQALQNGVRLETLMGEDLPPIRADEARMLQALGNLVANALRYTPSGGQVTLSARATPSQVFLAVADAGAGIAPDHLPNVFERFYRADDAREQESGGSGLGLAIVKSIVEAHGGQVSAQSALGQGSTFTVALPAAS